VDKVQLGNHRLLLVNQVDARTEDGERVQIALHSATYFTPELKHTRNINLYAQCLISGCRHIVLGTRTKNQLHYTRTFTSLSDFIEKKELGNVQECLQFQNRLLSWMRSHLTVIISLRSFKIFYKSMRI